LNLSIEELETMPWWHARVYLEGLREEFFGETPKPDHAASASKLRERGYKVRQVSG